MIQIADLELDDPNIAVRERRDTDPDLPARTITIHGAVNDADTVELIEEQLDLIARACGDGDELLLSLRPGRHLHARLLRIEREANRVACEGVYRAVFVSDDLYEEADADREQSWTITAWGATLAVDPHAAVPGPVRITLTAVNTIVRPAVEDGIRRIEWSGSMAPGDVIVFDGITRRATLNGSDITAQTNGDYPQLGPDPTTFLFLDDFDSSHHATATLRWRPRWR